MARALQYRSLLQRVSVSVAHDPFQTYATGTESHARPAPTQASGPR